MARLLISVLAMVLISVLSIIGVAQPTKDDDIVAAFFPPWWSDRDSYISAAEKGPVFGMGRLPFVVLVPARGNSTRARGEWLRVGISNLPGCFSEREQR